MPVETLGLLLSPVGLGLVGLCVGSFLNVLIHRMPLMDLRDWWQFDIGEYALQDERAWRPVFGEARARPRELAEAARAIEAELALVPELTLSRPRSRCPACGHGIRWYENIPLLSWLALRGRCSACGAPISWRYPFVELLTAALFAACASVHGASPLALLYCAVLALLVVKAGIDIDATLIPEGLTLSLLGLGAAASLAGWSGVSPSASLAGALTGFLLLWIPGAVWKYALRKPNAMGIGDMKMMAGLGALFGWQALPGILMLAACAGAALGILMLALSGKGRDTKLAFGPYLSLAGAATIFLPDTLREFGLALQSAFGA